MLNNRNDKYMVMFPGNISVGKMEYCSCDVYLLLACALSGDTNAIFLDYD